MARAVGYKNRFNSGELAEEAWSASDLEMHAHGCGMARNWMPRVTGPLQRRYGFWFNGVARHDDRQVRLMPFVRTRDDALMLEWGDEYLRVWKADGTRLMNGGSIFEIATDYTEDQVHDIRPHQSGDVIFLCHANRTVQTRVLKRTDELEWSISLYEFRNGPWRPENADNNHHMAIAEVSSGGFDEGATVDLYSEDGSGTSTFVSYFDANWVGSYVRLRPSNGNPGVNSWAPLTDVSAGQAILSDGKIYLHSGGSTKTGRTPPTHDRGEVSDGGCEWTFHDDGAAVLKVVSFTDEFAVRCEVIRSVPKLFGGTTPNWAESAFSPRNGWPTAWPSIREERLVMAGGGEADKIDLSRTAGFFPDYADYTPNLGTGRVADDDAVRRYCGDTSSRVVWTHSAAMLLAGTRDGVVAVTGGTLDDPISPNGTTAREMFDYGAEDVAPVKAHGAVLYVTRGGVGLREVRVGGDLGTGTRDLSFFVEHLAGKGFAELAWTAAPDNLLWARHDDGSLSLFVYHDEQKVYGWAPVALGGGFTAESLAVMPGAYGRDALWIIAHRVKDDDDQRFVMMLSARREVLRLDCAMRYSGTPATGVDGLAHAVGEEVILMAGPGDGSFAEYRVTVDEAAAATLPEGRTAAEIVAGFEAVSRYEGLPDDLVGPGTTAGKRTRVTRIVAFLKGIAVKVGVMGPEIGEPPLDEQQARPFEALETLRPERFHARIGVSGGADRDVRLVVEAGGGFDCLLMALRPTEWAND